MYYIPVINSETSGVVNIWASLKVYRYNRTIEFKKLRNLFFGCLIATEVMYWLLKANTEIAGHIIKPYLKKFGHFDIG